MKNEMSSLAEMLLSIADMLPKAWLYLPKDKPWTLQSRCAVLESDEVPPEMEDEPDAGVPEFAKQNNLAQVFPVTVVQEIVANAQSQSANASPEVLFKAFCFYYEHDAFIKL